MCCWEASAEGLWSCIVLSGELAVSKAEGNIMDVIYIYIWTCKIFKSGIVVCILFGPFAMRVLFSWWLLIRVSCYIDYMIQF